MEKQKNIKTGGKILMYSTIALLFFLALGLTKPEFLEKIGTIYGIIFVVVVIFWIISYAIFAILIIKDQLKRKKYFWGISNILLLILALINLYSSHWIAGIIDGLLLISIVSYYFLFLNKGKKKI